MMRAAKTATGTLDDDNDPLTPLPVIEFVGDDDGDGVWHIRHDDF